MTAPSTTSPTPLRDRIERRAGIVAVTCPPWGHPIGCPHTPEERRATDGGRPRWLQRLQAKDLTGSVAL